MGCDTNNGYKKAADVFQSTHPCGVRPLEKASISKRWVSIHAPVWGATFKPCAIKARQTVSIHAPVWGATAIILDDVHKADVSIHAPVWGATIINT